MSADGPWLNLPQAVVLEATRDIKLALDLTEDDPVLLVIKANQRIALRTVIPLEEDANNEQRRDAIRRMRDERAAVRDSDRYLEAQQQPDLPVARWRQLGHPRARPLSIKLTSEGLYFNCWHCGWKGFERHDQRR